jgi:hypothetical protein
MEVVLTCYGDCVPAVTKRNSAIASVTYSTVLAREALILREGPPPFEGAVCRHLCKNDSMAPNGFVCTLHTTWGTVSENMMDKPEYVRSQKRALSPNAPMQKQRTCPHCGKVGAGPGMVMWHFDKCRSLPQNLL